MRYRSTFVPAAVIACAGLISAQTEEFARIVRTSAHSATLTAFGPRPVDLAAKKLVEEFGVAINVEDPVYRYRDDVQDIGGVGKGRPLLIPRSSLIETHLDLREDGSLRDLGQVVAALADAANAQLPFLYRIDNDGETFTLAATRTRDERGRDVDATPILDRRVTIPAGTRRVFEHANLLTQALEAQTGVRIGCCQAAVSGIPWGSTLVSFEARDEPARHVLLRLLRSEPARDRLVRKAPGGVYDLVKSEPGREHWHWLLRCQPGEAWCFINVAAIPAKP